MSYRTAIRAIMREYELSRQKAEKIIDEKRISLHNQFPKLAEIEKNLNVLGASLARMALDNNIEGLAETRENINALKEERRILLNNADFFVETDAYNCAKCLDTGYIQENASHTATRCPCLSQRLINEYYALSNLEEILMHENFDTFDVRLFSEELNKAEGLSPNVNMQHVYRLATQFVANFNKEFDNLLMYGETGLGKTFICHSIAKDLLDKGHTVLYLTAPRLCKVIEDYRFNRDALTEPDEMLEAVDTVDLLILDDLGAEVSTVITSAALFDIINQRLISRKPTVISTNMTPTALEAQYSERIVSRFFGNYQMIKFFGDDVRVKKKYGNLRI